jgi:hypothetical protein
MKNIIALLLLLLSIACSSSKEKDPAPISPCDRIIVEGIESGSIELVVSSTVTSCRNDFVLQTIFNGVSIRTPSDCTGTITTKVYTGEKLLVGVYTCGGAGATAAKYTIVVTYSVKSNSYTLPVGHTVEINI